MSRFIILLSSLSLRFTYLDSQMNGGRKVIVLKASNLVEDHDQKVVVTYEFPASKMIVEPFMLVGAFLIVFVICSFLSRASAITTKALDSLSSK